MRTKTSRHVVADRVKAQFSSSTGVLLGLSAVKERRVQDTEPRNLSTSIVIQTTKDIGTQKSVHLQLSHHICRQQKIPTLTCGKLVQVKVWEALKLHSWSIFINTNDRFVPKKSPISTEAFEIQICLRAGLYESLKTEGKSKPYHPVSASRATGTTCNIRGTDVVKKRPFPTAYSIQCWKILSQLLYHCSSLTAMPVFLQSRFLQNTKD